MNVIILVYKLEEKTHFLINNNKINLQNYNNYSKKPNLVSIVYTILYYTTILCIFFVIKITIKSI